LNAPPLSVTSLIQLALLLVSTGELTAADLQLLPARARPV
jgi:hypothetical protein